MKVLAIPDLHCPAQHPEAFDFIEHILLTEKPDSVVLLGDELDIHAVSRWPKNPDLPGAKEELRDGIKQLKNLYSLVPDMRVCTSNHTSRPYRMAATAGIPSLVMRSYNEWMEAPENWYWEDEWIIDGAKYIHGDPQSGPTGTETLVKRHNMTIIHGHFHSHAVAKPFPLLGNHFGANSGCLINPNHETFRYAKNSEASWLGVTIVNDGVPHLVPMKLNKNGRWAKSSKKRTK